MEGIWQDFSPEPVVGPPYTDRYAVEVRPGQFLVLPIRPLPEAGRAVASFIANQGSFEVVDVIARAMGDLAAGLRAELIIGMPTLGLAFAPAVARGLGHSNFVPLGYSRKYWYREDHSVKISSITTPAGGKRLYIDPLIVSRLAGKRIVVIDDVVSSGGSLRAVTDLLRKLDVEASGYVVAMQQGDAITGLRLPVESVFQTPRFIEGPGGWWPA